MSARPGDLVELDGGALRSRPFGRVLRWVSVHVLYLVVAETKDDEGYCWLFLLGGHSLGWVPETHVERRLLCQATS